MFHGQVGVFVHCFVAFVRKSRADSVEVQYLDLWKGELGILKTARRVGVGRYQAEDESPRLCVIYLDVYNQLARSVGTHEITQGPTISHSARVPCASPPRK